MPPRLRSGKTPRKAKKKKPDFILANDVSSVSQVFKVMKIKASCFPKTAVLLPYLNYKKEFAHRIIDEVIKRLNLIKLVAGVVPCRIRCLRSNIDQSASSLDKILIMYLII